MTDQPTEPSVPAEDAVDADRDALAGEPEHAPDVPRLAPPDGTSAEPPLPAVIASLPTAAGGGPSYVDHRPPSFAFLAVVAVLSFASDIASKNWAERRLDGFPGNIPIWKDHIAFVLAKNKGGAWGLLQGANESVRRPFFLLVSVAAIVFIMTLYRKLTPRQRALKWGLPLVLGGALGNVFDRIRYGSVIDFIDCHLSWGGHDHHWPTFNVADVAICVGVGLMALDVFTQRQPPRTIAPPPSSPPAEPDAALAAETKT